MFYRGQSVNSDVKKVRGLGFRTLIALSFSLEEILISIKYLSMNESYLPHWPSTICKDLSFIKIFRNKKNVC